MNGHKTPSKPYALVVWDDAHGDSTTEVFEGDIKHSPDRFYSYGWVIRSDKDGITLASEWNPNAGSWRSTMFIPRPMVQEEFLITLTKKREKKVKAAVSEQEPEAAAISGG